MAWTDPTLGTGDDNARAAQASLGARLASMERAMAVIQRERYRGIESGIIAPAPLARPRYGAASPLSFFSYQLPAAVNVTTVEIDIDAANCVFPAFFVPPSGKVIVHVGCNVVGPGTLNSVMVGLREGTVPVPGSYRYAQFFNSTFETVFKMIPITGLIPGQRFVWKVCTKLDGGAGTGRIEGGPLASGHYVEGAIYEIVEDS